MKEFIIVTVIALCISCTLGSSQQSASFEPTGMRDFFIKRDTDFDIRIKPAQVGELKLVNIDGQDAIATKIGNEKSTKNSRLNAFGRRGF